MVSDESEKKCATTMDTTSEKGERRRERENERNHTFFCPCLVISVQRIPRTVTPYDKKRFFWKRRKSTSTYFDPNVCLFSWRRRRAFYTKKTLADPQLAATVRSNWSGWPTFQKTMLFISRSGKENTWWNSQTGSSRNWTKTWWALYFNRRRRLHRVNVQLYLDREMKREEI